MSTQISILLQEIKTATGWSEPALARGIGTSQPTVNRILNGQEECKATTYRAICDLHEKMVVGKTKKLRRAAA